MQGLQKVWRMESNQVPVEWHRTSPWQAHVDANSTEREVRLTMRQFRDRTVPKVNSQRLAAGRRCCAPPQRKVQCKRAAGGPGWNLNAMPTIKVCARNLSDPTESTIRLLLTMLQHCQ